MRKKCDTFEYVQIIEVESHRNKKIKSMIES
jgi:hypothetical protein